MSSTNGSGTHGTFGATSYDLADFPDHILHRLMHRAVSHVLGNEVSSKVGALIKKRNEAGETVNDAEKAAMEDDFRAAFIKAMQDGTWGSGLRASSGPRGPSVNRADALFAIAVKGEVIKLLNKAVKAGSVQVITIDGVKHWQFPNGSTPTLDDACASWQANPKNEATINALRDAAQVKADAEREAAALRANAASASGASAIEDLGL